MSEVGLLTVGAILCAALAIVMYRWQAERRRVRYRLEAATAELQRLQTNFARFAPSAVVERIVARGRTAYEAERRQVTVLFADLVSFTALSEALSPEVLVAVLNDYFVRMSQVIGDHRGHVAKFIGDGLMALFGALEPNPWQQNDAVSAALAMQEALAAYNDDLVRRNLPPLRVGIGIHSGAAVAGVIGSNELLEFTVIGRTVNLASRVERLTRVHAADILITAEVRAGLDPRFALEELPARAVHGVAEPVVTWAVRGIC